MKSRGFSETFPSIYVPSVINRFIFGHCVRIYLQCKSLLGKRSKYVPSVINRFIFGHCVRIYLQCKSLLGKRSKNLPCCPSKRQSLQSAILFCQQPQWFLRKQILWNLLFVDTFVGKLNWNRLSVCLRDVVSTWHHNVLLLTSLARQITLRKMKIEMRCLFVHLRCTLCLSRKWTERQVDVFLIRFLWV